MEKSYKLPKEFGEKFLIALRSGEYPQTKGKLKDGVGYCCLGIACLLQGKNDDDIQGKYYPSIDWLPKETLDVPKNGGLRLEARLANMNDEGKTFLEIADWVEQNVEFFKIKNGK